MKRILCCLTFLLLFTFSTVAFDNSERSKLCFVYGIS